MYEKEDESQKEKVILIGDSSVGKTSILMHFSNPNFDSKGTQPTIGASYVPINVQTKNGVITLNFWDTAGQERFRSIVPMYCRSCSAILLVASVDSEKSVQNLDKWEEEVINEIEGRSAKIYVIINKVDLEGYDHVIQEAQKWANKHQYPLFQTSIYDHKSIFLLLQKIAADINITGNGGGLQKIQPNSQPCC